MNSNEGSEKGKKILEDVLASLNEDEALEFHLPSTVTNLDKAALLAVLYRVLARIS